MFCGGWTVGMMEDGTSGVLRFLPDVNLVTHVYSSDLTYATFEKKYLVGVL